MEFLPEAGRESNSECQGFANPGRISSLPAAVVVDDPPALGEFALDQREQAMRLLAVGERE